MTRVVRKVSVCCLHSSAVAVSSPGENVNMQSAFSGTTCFSVLKKTSSSNLRVSHSKQPSCLKQKEEEEERKGEKKSLNQTYWGLSVNTSTSLSHQLIQCVHTETVFFFFLHIKTFFFRTGVRVKMLVLLQKYLWNPPRQFLTDCFLIISQKKKKNIFIYIYLYLYFKIPHNTQQSVKPWPSSLALRRDSQTCLNLPAALQTPHFNTQHSIKQGGGTGTGWGLLGHPWETLSNTDVMFTKKKIIRFFFFLN